MQKALPRRQYKSQALTFHFRPFLRNWGGMGRNCSRCRAKIARGRGTRESWEGSKTERGVRDGKATDARENNVGQNTQAFHGPRNPPFWVHFQGKTTNAPCGTRAPTDFPGLTTLPPRTAGPSGRPPLPRAPNAPPSSQRRRPACNGLVPPPPPKPGAKDARRRSESNLRTPTLPPHPGRRLPAGPPAERLTSAARGGRLRRHRTSNMAAAAQAAHIRSADGDGTGSGSERERRAASSRQPWRRRQARSADADSPGHPPGLLPASRLP